MRDERFAGTPIEVQFRGNPRPAAGGRCQDRRARQRYPVRTTAFGKTAVAAWLIAKRKVNTLVLVHRQQLLDQWRERLAMFLDLPVSHIGQVGGGKMDEPA